MLYQKILSPDHGPLSVLYPYGFCRFTPTCSQFARQAIDIHGVLYGSMLTLQRIAKCNPWNKGGVDHPHK